MYLSSYGVEENWSILRLLLHVSRRQLVMSTPPSRPVPGAGLNGRPVVFFDITIGDTPVGRIKFELFSDFVPKYVIHILT